MANGNRVSLEDLGAAIAQELTIYHNEVVEKVDSIGQESIKKLVSLTRSTAPAGKRGEYRKSISSKQLVKEKNGSTYVWYAKSPNHRLTHLLVHGHETRDGGRTKANPFLQNALDTVLPEYEKKVEEAIKNG